MLIPMQTPSLRSNRPSVRGALALLALALFAALTLAACGDDDNGATENGSTDSGSTDSAAVRTIADNAVADLGISEADGLCLGKELVRQLGEDDAVALNQSDADLNELPEAEQTAVRDAFNKCVPGSALAEELTSEFYSEIGASTAPDQEVLDCVAAELDGKTGDVVFEGLSVDTAETDLTLTTNILDGCIPAELLTELFTTSFIEAGLTPDQAQCVADQLSGQVTLGQLVDLESADDELGAEFEALIEQAVTACT